MEYRPLNVTVVSAEGLKDIKLFGKMDLYAEISLAGYPQSLKKTFVDKNCGSNPKWNFKAEFIVDEPYLTRPGLSLLVRIKDDGTFGDKTVGSVTIPVHDLFRPDYAENHVVEYQVITSSGKPKGTLILSYTFGEKFTQTAPEPKHKHLPEEPVTAYPAAPGAYQAPPQGMGYPPPQYAQPSYAQTSGYGYQPQPNYAYGAPPPGGYAPYAQPPRKNKMGGIGGAGLGLGAGLLGGLLVGEAISDIGESAAYADGYDDAIGDFGF